MFAVDPETVSRWASTGKIPCIRTMGGHRRFRAEDVDRLMQDLGNPPIATPITNL